jgi:hypothetical protein
MSGLPANYNTGSGYELRFRAPGAGARTALLGLAASPYTNGLQRITNIIVAAGANLQGLNLPIDPNGVVYNAISRTPIPGATLTLMSAGGGTALPASCFDDPVQQGQVTLGDGYYKFDLNFSDPACPSGGDYVIGVTAPAGDYVAGYSQIIPPTSSAATPPLSVPSCPLSADDAIPATGRLVRGAELRVRARCGRAGAQCRHEVVCAPAHGQQPRAGLEPDLQQPHPARSGAERRALDLEDDAAHERDARPARPVHDHGPQRRQPVAHRRRDRRPVPRRASRTSKAPRASTVCRRNRRLAGLELRWAGLTMAAGSQHTLQLLLAVGAGVTEGEYVNRAQTVHGLTGNAMSGTATATVRVMPDPTFDCTDVTGKVFDDANRNGVQDDGERGLPGVRLATPNGLFATTDQYGRYHITCATTPDPARGSNFALKVDDRTLPSGFRMSTDQVQIKRATRGKALKFNFGASIYRVVGLDLADPVFEPGTTTMRIQWRPRVDMLLEELRKVRPCCA